LTDGAGFSLINSLLARLLVVVLLERCMPGATSGENALCFSLRVQWTWPDGEEVSETDLALTETTGKAHAKDRAPGPDLIDDLPYLRDSGEICLLSCVFL